MSGTGSSLSESGSSKKRKRAPTLYLIILFKLVKGTLLLLLALGVYKISDTNLPEQFRRTLEFLHLDPEKKFLSDLAVKIGGLSQSNVVWFARGTGLYSVFSLVEGSGLLLRVSWAGWLAIGESAFFIPIELYEIVERGFSWVILTILLLNLVIVWYLLQNRNRLFRH
jgi:Predicted membrane protein